MEITEYSSGNINVWEMSSCLSLEQIILTLLFLLFDLLDRLYVLVMTGKLFKKLDVDAIKIFSFYIIN